MLDWAITHLSDPFLCPYSTGPQWICLLRDALANDLSSTSPRTVVDVEGADTVDGEVAIEQTVPVPKLDLPPTLELGLSNRLKEVDLERHRLALGLFLIHQNHSLSFHLRYGWYSVTPQELWLHFWHALINVHGVPTRVHPRQRRIGPKFVLKT